MPGNLISLITTDTTIKVSSTLDKSVGKKYLVDGSPETCWTSQQGLPQHIQLTFAERVIPQRVLLTFQGGFVGTHCALYIYSDGNSQSQSDSGSNHAGNGNGAEGSKKESWRHWTSIYPEDVNRRQTFDLPPDLAATRGTTSVKLVFEQSSDFFGRITVYDLQLEGVTAPFL